MKSSQLDPAYIRYVIDALHNKDINSINSIDLPNGLIEFFEGAIDSDTQILAKIHKLEIFSIFALLKGGISIEFMSVLCDKEIGIIQEFIYSNSKFFNSKIVGKYEIYHERFRVYILQRIGKLKLNRLYEKLLFHLEESIKALDGGEIEQYALKYLASHYYEYAILNNDGEKLYQYVYSQSIWKRQLNIFKSYEWTRNGLNLAMQWATKSKSEEIIKSSLELIKLHHHEQDAIPQILALLEIGDTTTVIHRINQLSGHDTEDIYRRFLISMICLIQLVLQNKSTATHDVDSIRALLQYIDDNIPKDKSIFNWHDIFPSLLVFKIVKKLVKLDLNFQCIIERTNEFDCSWLSIENSLELEEYDILSQCCIISKDYRALKLIACNLAQQGYQDEAIFNIDNILHKELKDVTIQDICSIVVKQGEAQLAVRLVTDIKSSIIKSSTYINISEILYKKGETSLALSLLDEAQTLADNINDHENKCSLLVSISSELYNQGETQRALNLIEKATESVQYIEDLHGAKVGALTRIYSGLILQKEFALANEKINFAIAHAKTIPNEFDKTNSIEKLSLAFAHQELFDEAIACAHLLEETMKSGALTDVALVLIKNNNIEKAISCISDMGKDWYGQDFALSCVVKELIQIGQIEKALQYVQQIGSENHKDDALKSIVIELLNTGDTQMSLKYIRQIRNKSTKTTAVRDMAQEFSKQGKLLSVVSLFINRLKSTRSNTFIGDIPKFTEEIILDSFYKNKTDKALNAILYLNGANQIFDRIARLLAMQNIEKISIECVNRIENSRIRDKSIQFICSIFIENNKFELARRLVEDINNSIIKSSTYINISEILYKKGETSLALSLLDEAQTLADNINDHENKCSLLVSISSELYNQGETQRALNLIEKATESVQYIEDLHGAKVGALTRIYSGLILQKEFALANEKINFAIAHAKTIPNEFDKTNSIEKLSLAFAHQELFDEAIACAHLLEETMKSGALTDVALVLIKNNNIEKAISCISDMGKDWYGQDFALSCVVKELIQIGQIEKALQYVQQIGSENHKDNVLTELSLAHIKGDDFQMAIEFCSKISSAKIRNNCWKTIGSVYSKLIGIETAIFNSKKIAENRNKILYIYGIIMSIKIDENAQDMCKLIFPLCTSDYLNTKLLLEIYYTSELFYYSGTLPSQCTEFIDFDWALLLNKSLN